MSSTHFDLVIIGGGPGGTKAAFAAVAKGMRTALIESGFLGGACLNVGCIPTKYLLGATASLPLLAVQKKYRVASGDVSFDLAALQNRKERFIKGTRQALEKQIKEAGITLFAGRASFSGPTSVLVKGSEGESTLTFDKCIVATGSAPASFPGLKPDGASVRASSSILSLTEAPESLIIAGGGAIGLELGEIFHRLGSKITIAEGAPRILPGEDPEISEAVHAHLSREGWRIICGRRIASLTTVEEESQLVFEDGETIRAKGSMIAVGRRSTANTLTPEKAGVSLDARGWFATDEHLLCGENIYAIGDANGRIQLAHAAEHQARYAVAHAAGESTEAYTAPPVPGCVYGTMEVMRVGPTLAALQQEGGEIFVSKAPFAGNSIAQSYGHPQGFARALWQGNTLRALSAVGHGASHLVTAAALLVGQTFHVGTRPPVIFAHPTLDEVLESAILSPREIIREA